MKKAATLLALALIASTAGVGAGRGPVETLPQPAAPFEIGSTVPPDVVLKDIDGKEHSLGSLRGKVVLIHFWSIVCPYEKVAEPKLIELQKTYGGKGVVQIAVNANQKELAGDGGAPYANLRDHVEKAGVNFIVTVDHGNKLTDLFGGQTTPHCFVIDKAGVLKYAGALDDDPKGQKGEQATAYVRDALEAVLAGKAVAVTTTKPYG